MIFVTLIVFRDSGLKENLLESPLYISILEKIGWTYKGPLRLSIPKHKNQPPESEAPEERESNNHANNESLQDSDSYSKGKLGGKNTETQNGLNVNKTEEGQCRNNDCLRKQPVHSKDCEIFDLETKELNER